MADVKLVILSAFGAGALLVLLSIIAIIYLRRRSTGGVRRGLFAGSIVTLVIIIGLGSAGRSGLAAVLHGVPPASSLPAAPGRLRWKTRSSGCSPGSSG